MRKLKLPPFENVGANQTAIMPRLPMGETYHAILLKLGGGSFTKSQITQIKIRLGGKVIWDVTGDQLDSVNKYMGMTANAAYLLIPFSDFNARTIAGEPIGAIDTSLEYSDFSMEVKIGGATTPSLDAWRFTTPVKATRPEHRPLLRAMVAGTHNIGASGTYSLPIALGSNDGALLKRLFMFHSNITQFDVKLNGADLQDEGENGAVEFMQNNLTRVTQTGMLAYDPLFLDNQSDVIPTLNGSGKPNSFEFRATLSASDTINALSELYTVLANV